MNQSILWLAFGAGPFRRQDAIAVLGATAASPALTRLRQRGEAIRLGRGRYRLATLEERLAWVHRADAARRREGHMDDEQQVGLAAVAAASWRQWQRVGRIMERSPRRFVYRTGRLGVGR